MQKTILLTGATDGIGLETARALATQGHTLLLHGRSAQKLELLKQELAPLCSVQTFQADFAQLSQVRAMAMAIKEAVSHLDVLINNAGVFVTPDAAIPTVNGLDLRLAVNCVAPYVLTCALLPLLDETGRVVNLSSAAQMPLDFDAISAGQVLPHGDAYAQSKLGILMWGLEIGQDNPHAPSVIAVNPKSFLGSKMVKTAYGRQGFDLKIGSDILCRAALSDEFSHANGRYFDNDYGVFAQPHPFALDQQNRAQLMAWLAQYLR